MQIRDRMRRRDRARSGTVAGPAYPLSWVKVLSDEDELRDAVGQALEFERDVLSRTSARVAYYEGLDDPGQPVLLPVRPTEPPPAVAPDRAS